MERPAIQWLASGLVGAAVAVCAWWVIRVLQSEDLQQGAEWRYDISRINELRRSDAFYRLFQPAIQLLARLNRSVFRDEPARDLPADPGGRAAAVLAARRVPRQGGTDRLVPHAALRLLCSLLFGLGGLLPAFGDDARDGLVPAAAAGHPGRQAPADDQAPHAVPAGPADAADGGRLDVPQCPGPGRGGVPRPSRGRGVRPRADRHEPRQDPRRGLSGHEASGWPTTRSPASSARSFRGRTWARPWPRSSAPRPTCCG